MAKKRAREADGQTSQDVDRMDEDESSDEDDFDIVNVEFEWFNFDPEIDFHGTKSLLRQLFDVDATLFDISALAELILAQSTIGSTVKVDGKGNDAYAFLTCLNLAEHRGNEAVASLTRYLAEKARTNSSLAPVAGVLPSASGPSTSGPVVGLMLAERLINMPSEIVPPMYSMLVDEIEAAVEDNEPYEFTHYLILSKTYHEVQSRIPSDETEQRRKKNKGGQSPLFYFHPEDEVLQKHASAFGTYVFTKEETVAADSKRAFQEMGIQTQGSMILIEAAKFEGAVKAISEYLSPPS